MAEFDWYGDGGPVGGYGKNSGGGGSSKTAQFSVGFYGDYEIDHPPIAVNGVPYSGKWEAADEQEGVVYIGTTHVGDIVTIEDGFAALSTMAGFADCTFDEADECEWYECESMPYIIVSSKASMLSMFGVGETNLYMEYTQDSTRQEADIQVNNSDIILRFPASVPVGATLKVLGADEAWYRIGDGELIEIEDILDVGMKFTMPDGKVTIVVKAVDHL